LHFSSLLHLLLELLARIIITDHFPLDIAPMREVALMSAKSALAIIGDELF